VGAIASYTNLLLPVVGFVDAAIRLTLTLIWLFLVFVQIRKFVRDARSLSAILSMLERDMARAEKDEINILSDEKKL